MSQEVFDEAIRLEENGQAESALLTWRELASSSPTLNVFLRLASCAKDLGLIDEAERAFSKALEIDDHSALAMAGLGSLAINRRDYELAADYLQRACDVQPQPGRLTMLGVALCALGRDSEAEECYRTAICLDSTYEEAYFNLGVLLRDDRPSQAQVLFEKALEFDADYAAAHRELGWVLHASGSDKETEGHLRRAVELDPDDAWAHIYVGSYLWDADVNGAIAEFHIARELEPEWTVPLWSLGNIHEFVVEDFNLAQSFFERALQMDPDDTVTLTNFGRLCNKRGQTGLARQYLRRAISLDPRCEKARSLLADMEKPRDES